MRGSEGVMNSLNTCLLDRVMLASPTLRRCADLKYTVCKSQYKLILNIVLRLYYFKLCYICKSGMNIVIQDLYWFYLLRFHIDKLLILILYNVVR